MQDQAGRTPLQCAAYGGYITCMAVLMENNADPNIQDKEVRISLHFTQTSILANLLNTNKVCDWWSLWVYRGGLLSTGHVTMVTWTL